MNLNYLYKKGCYKWLEEKNADIGAVIKANDELINRRYECSDELIELCEEGQCFSLNTVYPGLLIGLGELHTAQIEKEKGKEELKLGFSLDYTTGMPYIPASGMKGALRSVFSAYPEYIEEYCDSIADIREKIAKEMPEAGEVVKDIEAEIFDGGKDVFFAAIPHAVEDHEKRLLGIDYITPHTTKIAGMDGLTTPDPLKMLKVMPGVSYVFRFHLQDGRFLKKEEKLELFRQSLLDFGVGAKTNVGFGIMAEDGKQGGTTPYCHLREVVKPYNSPKTGGDGGKTDAKPGKCRSCGKMTKINRKTNQPYPYCYDCNPNMKAERAERGKNGQRNTNATHL